MEPVPEESGRMDEMKGSSRLRGSPFQHTKPSKTPQPSKKYTDIEEAVSKVTLRQAQAPPKPTLPKRSGVKQWTATAKERNPLASSLTGARFCSLEGKHVM